jgi:hypothetical protein
MDAKREAKIDRLHARRYKIYQMRNTYNPPFQKETFCRRKPVVDA